MLLSMFSLREKVFGVVAILLLLALGSLFAYHKMSVGLLQHELSEARETVGRLEVDKATLKASVSNLTASLTEQNIAIQSMVKARQEAVDKAESALKAERQLASKWKKQYEGLFSSPRVGTDDCKSVAIKLDQYIAIRKQEKASKGLDKAVP